MKKTMVFTLLTLIPSYIHAQEFLGMKELITYTWIDESGAKHFSSDKPIGISNYESVVTKYPVFSIPESQNDWKYIGITGENESSAAFSIRKLKHNSQASKASNLLWYRFDYLNKSSELKSAMFLVRIHCGTSQIEDIQQQQFLKSGKTNSTKFQSKRYSVPNTTDEDLINYFCKN